MHIYTYLYYSPTTLGGPWEAGALCNRRSTAVPVGPPRPSSITHPEAAPATVTCSYIVAGTDGFLAGATHYTARRRRSVPPWGTHRPGGVRFPCFFPWMAGHPCLTLRARSLSLQGDPVRNTERDDPGTPVVPGRLWIGFGSRTLERAGR